MHNPPRLILALILGLLSWALARADMVVVMNARSAVEALSREQVVNIFLGRYRVLPGGVAALPIDHPDMAGERARFYRLLVDKSPSEIDAYWARLTFSGKTPPPRLPASTQEQIAWLLRDKGAVAYMERQQVDARLRVVHALEP